MRKLASRLLRGLWRDDGSIAQKTVRGSVWLMGSSSAIRGLRILQTAILARLLIPADFGLMRLAMVVMSASGAFTQFGISTALVQRKDMSRRLMDTAWMLDLCRNLIVLAAAMLLAGPMAAFYDAPALRPILRVIALKFLFMGLSNNSGVSMLRREMAFRRKQIYETCLNLAAVAVTLALAVWLRSVWALVWGQVFYGLGEMIGSYVIHPFRPRFRIYRAEALALFQFGKHLFVGGVLGFLRGSLASLLVGKVLGIDALGYFSLARSLVVLPVAFLTPAFGVLFPAFARLQSRPDVLRRAFVRALRLGCLAICPVLVGIGVTAGPLVALVYGGRWAPVAPIAVAFCFVTLLSFCRSPVNTLLLAIGKPALNNLGSAISLVVLTALTFPLARAYGAIGVVAAVGIAAATDLAIRGYYAMQKLGLSLPAVVAAIGRPLAVSLLMGACVWVLGRQLSASALVSLATMVPAGAALYFLLSLAANRPGLREAREAIAKVATA